MLPSHPQSSLRAPCRARRPRRAVAAPCAGQPPHKRHALWSCPTRFIPLNAASQCRAREGELPRRGKRGWPGPRPRRSVALTRAEQPPHKRHAQWSCPTVLHGTRHPIPPPIAKSIPNRNGQGCFLIYELISLPASVHTLRPSLKPHISSSCSLSKNVRKLGATYPTSIVSFNTLGPDPLRIPKSSSLSPPEA